MKHKVEIKGVITSNDEKWLYDMFEMDSTTPKDVSTRLVEAQGQDVEVIINSGGGSVFDASEIYTELKSYPGNVDVKIVGIAASAASIIAMSGDKVSMTPTGQMMIHNASNLTRGDYREMESNAEMLKATNETIANAYALKSGISQEDLLEMMNKETWLIPEVALEKGLIDEVMFTNENIKVAASLTGAIPQQVIDGLRNKFSKDPKGEKPEAITQESIVKMFDEMKKELKNELQPLKEPIQEPAKANLSRLFLNTKK